jgi:hypothetical protein
MATNTNHCTLLTERETEIQSSRAVGEEPGCRDSPLHFSSLRSGMQGGCGPSQIPLGNTPGLSQYRRKGLHRGPHSSPRLGTPNSRSSFLPFFLKFLRKFLSNPFFMIL